MNVASGAKWLYGLWPPFLLQPLAAAQSPSGLWDNIDWGNAPAWAGLVAATVAAGVSLRTLRDSRTDQREAQARKVAAWWGPKDEGRVSPGGLLQLAKLHDYGVLLRNASDLPVYDVRVDLRQADSHRGNLSERRLPEVSIPVLRPAPEPMLIAEVGQQDGPLVVGSLAFTDANGRRWRRSAGGRLEILRTSSPSTRPKRY